MLTLDTLLVARDFTAASDQALRQALDLAARTGATLHVFHAYVLHEKGTGPEDRSPRAGVEEMRDALKEQDGAAPPEALDMVDVTEGTERDVAAAPAILNYASQHEVDLIALGSHGRQGPKRVLLGSVAEEVVRRARTPVLTVRAGEDIRVPTPGSVDRILVPVDFSEPSREGFRHAREIAQLYDAQVDLLHVVEEILRPAFYVEDLEVSVGNKSQGYLQQFVQETPGPDVDVEMHARSGAPAPAVTAFVDEHDIDLVVASTRGRTGVKRLLLGSVAEKIVRHVQCPVFTVKAIGKSLVPSTSR